MTTWTSASNIVLEERPDARRGATRRWQMNEINALIWPNKLGDRRHEPGRVRADGAIAKTYEVIKKPATDGAYRTDLAKKAVANLEEGRRATSTGKSCKKTGRRRSRKAASSDEA